MKVKQYEVMQGKDGKTYYNVREIDKTYPGEGQGRHSKICEMCGFSTYPECMKHCQNGNGSRG